MILGSHSHSFISTLQPPHAVFQVGQMAYTATKEKNENIKDKEMIENTIGDLNSVIKDNLKNNTFNMLSDTYFANVIRSYFVSNPKEYTKELKNYKNDFPNLCNGIATEANDLMRTVVYTNGEYAKKEHELARKNNELVKMISEGKTLDNKEVIDKKMEILGIQKEMAEIPPTIEQDMRFCGKNLSGFIGKVSTALMEIEPESEPSDLDIRKSIKFEKKMDLPTALFTLLWNTRHETIPISVLNLKGWASRFVKRLDGEYESQNQPTMLILRSRTDNGKVKGNSGKTTIVKSCLKMLKSKGLNVSSPDGALEIPTRDRVDKGMSDKTMVFFDDMVFDNVDWEKLNKFLDGNSIKNKGKYLKEGYIFGFGNIIGTTNYDLPYPNKERYPVVEFTPNDAPIVAKDPCVVEHANFICDEANRVFDFSDAWETLFSYAQDNKDKWLDEYAKEKNTVASGCSCQRTKLESLIISYLDSAYEQNKTLVESALTKNPEAKINRKKFTPTSILEHIKQNYRDEFRSLKLGSVVDALFNLDIERSNTTENPYLMSFYFPDRQLDIHEEKNSVEEIWSWISMNAEKTPSEQTTSSK